MTTDTEPTADDVRLKAERNGDLPAGYGAYDVQPENQREGPCTIISAGLTKREMLAGMAMQGMLASPEYCYGKTAYAEHAVQYADALLKELAK